MRENAAGSANASVLNQRTVRNHAVAQPARHLDRQVVNAADDEPFRERVGSNQGPLAIGQRIVRSRVLDQAYALVIGGKSVKAVADAGRELGVLRLTIGWPGAELLTQLPGWSMQ